MANLCEYSITRRSVLGSTGALFASTFIPRTAFAAGARDSRLICIVLRGALDGLSAVPPIGDPGYAGLRGDIALSKEGEAPALDLDGFFGIHPAMPNFTRLFRAGHASVIHAVATGYRQRSHFDGQDVLESGQPSPGLTKSGWLNRTIGVIPAGYRIDGNSALGVGLVAPLIVRGPAPVLGWAPPYLARADDDTVSRLLRLYADTDPLLEQQLKRGFKVDQLIGMGAAQQSREGHNPMAEVAIGAARLVAADDGPRVAALAYGGWDTHVREGGATGALAKLLSDLDGAFAEFETHLQARWRDTVILVMTEFGRTAHVNGSAGTDHGTGTVAFLLGGGVKGGRVITDWPGLRPAELYDGRDLKPTADLRAVAKGVVGDLFGLSVETLGTEIFPGSATVLPMRGLIT